MKINIQNKSKKKRSLNQTIDLKKFTLEIANKLKISEKFENILLVYADKYNGYYSKGDPFIGFKLLWNGKRIKIVMSQHFDKNQNTRKELIIHELTHAKQLISKKLIILGKTVIWKGSVNKSWRKFRFSHMELLMGPIESR